MTIESRQIGRPSLANGAGRSFQSLLPRCCEVAEDDPCASEAGLYPVELAAIAAATPARRREFAAGRRSARRALARLGHSGVSIPVGPMREPIFPYGVLGTITHCPNFCAAAVALEGHVQGIGIDAEPERALEPGIARLVLGAGERLGLPPPDVVGTQHPEVVVFSAKEAFYKALFPSCRVFLDFLDVSVVLHPGGGTFEVTVHCPLVPGAWRARPHAGKYAVADGIVYTAVVL